MKQSTNSSLSVKDETHGGEKVEQGKDPDWIVILCRDDDSEELLAVFDEESPARSYEQAYQHELGPGDRISVLEWDGVKNVVKQGYQV